MTTILLLILVALSVLQETLEWKTNYIDEFKENLSYICPLLVCTVFVDIVLVCIIFNII